MRNKKYTLTIKGEKMNDYIRGRITGIVAAITRADRKTQYAFDVIGDTTVITYDANWFQHNRVVKIITTLYSHMFEIEIKG